MGFDRRILRVAENKKHRNTIEYQLDTSEHS